MINLTDEELKEQLNELNQEVERRKIVKKLANKPKQLDIINTDILRKSCQDYLDACEDGYDHEQLCIWIVESAMEAIFGKDVYNWINKQLS